MTSIASGKDFGSAKRKILTAGRDFSKTRPNSDLNRAEVTFPGGSLALFHIPGKHKRSKYPPGEIERIHPDENKNKKFNMRFVSHPAAARLLCTFTKSGGRS
jgi:hypothetical protein